MDYKMIIKKTTTCEDFEEVALGHARPFNLTKRVLK